MLTSSSRLRAALGVAVVYVATAKFGSTLALVATPVTLVWPPTGVSLAALVILGTDLWPGVLLGALVANLTAGEPVFVALAIAGGNTLEAFTGAWLLRRYGNFRPALNRLMDAVALVVFGALASTTLGATFGVASLCLSGLQPWASCVTLWWTWWLGDAAGDLLFAPLLLTWTGWRLVRTDRTKIAEGLVLGSGLLLTTVLVFAGTLADLAGEDQLKYTVFPFVIWAAIRFGVRGVATVNALLAIVAVWTTMHGYGPYTLGPGNERLMLLQVFLAVVAGTGLMLAAAIAERNGSEARKIGMLEAALDCIITTDHHGYIVEFNPAAEATFGYRRGEVMGLPMTDLIIPESLRADYQEEQARAADPARGGRRFEMLAVRADGSEFPVEVSIARIPDTDPPMVTSFIRDITEHEHVVRQLAFRAAHDGLTELLNRAAFMSRLGDAVRQADGGTIAVLFVDLDRFKSINDRLGHGVGDRLLVAAARRLRGCVRPSDTLARLGGDEFAILIERVTDDTDVAGVADRIRRALDQPFSIDRHDLVVTASIGIALSSDEVVGAEDLLRAADSAMYRAKATSRGRSGQ